MSSAGQMTVWEDGVVLADEVVAPGVGRIPPRFPGIGRAAQRCLLDAGGEVVDHSLEPDVEPLVLVTGHRDGNAPLDIAGDRASLESFHVVPGEVQYRGPPEVFVVLEIAQDRRPELGQVQNKVLRLADHRNRTVDLRPRITKLQRIQDLAAVVALVAAGLGIATIGTGALDIAVGEKAPERLRVELVLPLGVQVPVTEQGQKDALGDRVMVRGVRVREESMRCRCRAASPGTAGESARRPRSRSFPLALPAV